MSSSKVFQKVSPGSGGIRTHAPKRLEPWALPDKGSSDNILEMSSNVELHSQSRRSSMTFGPIASKCFNISSQSKERFLTFSLNSWHLTYQQYRGECRRHVSAYHRCQSTCRTASEGVRRGDIILSGGACRGQKSSGLSSLPTTSVLARSQHHLWTAKLHFMDSETSFYNQIQRYNGQRQVRNYNVIAYF